MIYHPCTLPTPSNSTRFPLLMLLSRVYVGPGPYQQPVKLPIVGGFGVAFAIGGRVAASVGLGVDVTVAVGVGLDAAAVSVKIV